MSDNKYLWTLYLPSEYFVDILDSVVHFSGIKIDSKYLMEEDRNLLRIVGQKINEFSNELIDKKERIYIVKTLNRTRRTLSSIYGWLKNYIPFEEGVTYDVDDIIPLIDNIIEDKNIYIPLFDIRFTPRSTFGQCVQVNLNENEKAEKEFNDKILYPGFNRDVYITRDSYNNYIAEIRQTDNRNNLIDMRKHLRYKSCD